VGTIKDGVQRDYGQVKVSVHLDDNPDLAANNYTAEFMIIGGPSLSTAQTITLDAPGDPSHKLSRTSPKSE
jgi:hypothetical protein